ncbi:MAG: OprO/OprP family phosphate-selective porin [Bacteroidia bacterium]|nr:OprO/OprP family phosphate-selective porin [Bacteroidia bacterium]MBT8269532.1 OprO/OprP family phosphate-selective porin [Bacteroidia bacterium]NNF81802.1 porin [Flavobacteriaceae bacterium]NNK69785.1 porin [Flavobacteriaceae bacterium]NNL80439.1 porin [Flavobacteriaceae bacterium]
MIKKIVYLLLLGLLIPFNSVNAQGCEDDLIATENDSLAPAVRVFGFIQPEYNYEFTDENDSQFDFRRARVGVRGKIIDDFSYYMMIEASPFINLGGSGSDAFLLDAFVTWNKYNWYRVSLGSFKEPFSLELATACHSLITVQRSIVVDQLIAPQRDYGIMLLGGNQFTKFTYAISLMNGRGIGVSDDNRKKDFVGRATYKVTDFLTLGASFRYGYPIPNNDDDFRRTVGGEFKLDLNNFHFQGEYIYDEGAYFLGAAGGCGVTPVSLGEKRDGAYIMAYYDTKWNFQPVLKYEYFDADLDMKDLAYQEMMTIGFNYFFSDKVRVQVNYQARIETVNSVDNDVLIGQVQVRF